MKRYRCYHLNDFGDDYDAFREESEYGAYYLASDVDARIAELERLLDVERRAVAAAHGSAEIAVRWEVEAKKLGERVKAWETALRLFAKCNLNETNCASLEIATKRIRNIAREALGL